MLGFVQEVRFDWSLAEIIDDFHWPSSDGGGGLQMILLLICCMWVRRAKITFSHRVQSC